MVGSRNEPSIAAYVSDANTQEAEAGLPVLGQPRLHRYVRGRIEQTGYRGSQRTLCPGELGAF